MLNIKARNKVSSFNLRRYMEKYKEIERSIIKKFRKEIWARFVRAVNEYELITDGDKIMVCISGGKDSFLLAKAVQELQRHGQIDFDVKYLVMDPGYNKINRELIIKLAKEMNIDIDIFESDIFEVVDTVDKNPCYLCAKMRRGYLYAKAEELNCNKIALGHHFDDVIETTLLSIFYGSEIKTMMPKLRSKNFEGIELIRPLYYIKEEDIISWAGHNDLKFLNCACSFSEKTNAEENSKRKEIKNFIKDYKKINPNIDHNIFKSVENVNLEAILGYKVGSKHIKFLEKYKDQ